MNQLLTAHSPPETCPPPYGLTTDQTLAARAAYERVGHHRYVRWDDLPTWQQAGYHRLALVDQIAAMQQVIQLSGAIQELHDELVAAVAADVAADGWAVSPPDSPSLLPVPDIGRDPHLDALVRRVLHAIAEHFGPAVRS